MANLYSVGQYPLRAVKKRKVFFSFDFDDIMRVNNVRNSWKIDHPDAPYERSFYDSSLWESKKLEADEALKRLMREGVQQTSAVCVLIGSKTWESRWVRYEMARAVIDGRGLLGVHVNNINHHVWRRPSPLGYNPLAQLAVGKVQINPLVIPQYYLFTYVRNGWSRYPDYTNAVDLPPYLRDPSVNQVVQLSEGCGLYDFALQEGHRNIGRWIDAAAQAVGR